MCVCVVMDLPLNCSQLVLSTENYQLELEDNDDQFGSVVPLLLSDAAASFALNYSVHYKRNWRNNGQI